jgi:hypothetical protein
VHKPEQTLPVILLRAIHKLTIEELEVGTLRVRDLEVENR